MHELALMDSVVAAVEARVRPARVAAIRLLVGRLAGVEAHALRFCFEACAQGTALEGAILEIEETGGLGACRACGTAVTMNHSLDLCACGSADIEVLAGQDLRVKHVEIA